MIDVHKLMLKQHRHLDWCNSYFQWEILCDESYRPLLVYWSHLEIAQRIGGHSSRLGVQKVLVNSNLSLFQLAHKLVSEFFFALELPILPRHSSVTFSHPLSLFHRIHEIKKSYLNVVSDECLTNASWDVYLVAPPSPFIGNRDPLPNK